MGRRLAIFIFLQVLIPYAFGGAGLTYHGRLMGPDGSPVVSSAVQFRLQIRSPGSESCLMYEEIQTKDLSSSNGVFALNLNDGSGARQDSNSFTLDQLFSNRIVYNFAGSYCTTGTSYTPGATDSRKLVVYFNDGTFSGWEPAPTQAINYVPMAMDSLQVAGYQKDQLLKLADGVTTTGSELNLASWTELKALIAGTSTQFVKPGAATFTAAPQWAGTPSAANDLANKSYVDSQMAAGLPNIGTAGTYTKVTTDVKGRVTSGTTLAEADLPSLATAGKVDGGAINAGTIAGSTAINTSGNLVTTGTVQGGNVNGTNLRVYNGANYVQLAAPALSGNVNFKLPSADGTTGQVLSTDGSGAWGWITPGGGLPAAPGTAAAPGYAFSGNTNTGLFGAAANQIGLSTNGVERVRVDASGNVGIGTIAPVYTLDIAGQVGRIFNDGASALLIRSAGGSGTGAPEFQFQSSRGTVSSPSYPVDGDSLGQLWFNNHTGNAGALIESIAVGVHGSIPARSGGKLIFSTSPSGTNNITARMVIADSGNVGVGTATPAALLDVNGTMRVNQICDSTGANCKTVSGGWGGATGLSGLTAATAATTIDNTNFAQTWNWSTATTQNPMSLSANALTTGSLLNLTSSSASLNSTNGLLNVANTGASTAGTVARIQSNSTAGSGLSVLANGNVGIGTSSPAFRLSLIGDGGILSTGTLGSGNTLTVSGAGTRMFWYPRKASFRAGQVTGTQWDDANIGLNSVAFGYNTQAGNQSAAFGLGAVASGDYTVAMGQNTTASGSAGFAAGSGATSNGTASIALGLTTTSSAIGSIALGRDTQALSNSSVAIGDNSIASSNYAITLGRNNTASGYNSLSVGYGSVGSGDNSMAIGTNVTAASISQTTFGQYNLPTGGENALSWVTTDPLFVVGNGTSAGAGRSNALMILKNGNIGVGTSSPTTNLDVAGTVRIRGGNPAQGRILASDATGVASWSTVGSVMPQFLTSGTGVGSMVIQRIKGNGQITLTNGSTAIVGIGTNFIGDSGPTTMNYWWLISVNGAIYFISNITSDTAATLTSAWTGPTTTTDFYFNGPLAASGQNSMSLGYRTSATGDMAIATGDRTHADGVLSTASGALTYAIGNNSVAQNNNTVAESFAETVVGSWNIQTGVSATAWVPTDPIFVIGNGSMVSAKSNAMTVLKNGNVGLGTTGPGSTLDVKGTIRLSGSTSGYVAFAPAAAAGSTTYTLPAADGTAGQFLSTNGSGVLSWGSAAGSGTVTNVSSANADIGVATGSSTPVLTLNSGTGNNQIVKLDATAKLPAVDGSALTSINAVKFQGRTLAGTAPSLGAYMKWNNSVTQWEPAYFSVCNGATQVMHYTAITDVWSCDSITADLLLPTQTGNNGKVLTTDGTTTSWAAAGGTVSGTSGKIAKFTSGTAVGDSVMKESGGNIGIGTTSMGYKLNVLNSVNITSDATGAGNEVIASAPGLNIGSNDGGATLQYNSNRGLDLWNYDTSLTWTNHVTFTRDGAVGIGTNLPSQKLEVVGNVNVGSQTTRTSSTNRGQLGTGSSFVQTQATAATVNWNYGNVQEVASFQCNGSNTITMSNLRDGAAYSLLLTGAQAHSGVCVFSAAGYTFKTSGGASAPTPGQDVLFTFAVINTTVVYSMSDNLQ